MLSIYKDIFSRYLWWPRRSSKNITISSSLARLTHLVAAIVSLLEMSFCQACGTNNLHGELLSKIPFKDVKRFSFFEIEKSSKIAILPASRRRKLCILLSLVQVNAMISIFLLWMYSACLAVSKALIWLSTCYNILGRYIYPYRSSWTKGLSLAHFNTIKSPLVHWILSPN